jgi:outer membrane protein, heavy metal efflux system
MEKPMKVIHGLLLAFLSTSLLWAQTGESAKEMDLLAGAERLLPATQAHHAATTVPLTLQELQATALENNAELRAVARKVAVAEARRGSAGSLEDASFTYRGWGTPLRKPWDLNQTQHMFMYSQELPGSGKRQLRARLVEDDVAIAKAELETRKREVVSEVSRSFYELLRNQEELRFHDEQVMLARQGLDAARIKYVVGKVPQQDMLKAQIALTRLVEHLVMLQQDSELARSRLNTLLGRDPGRPLEITGTYSPPGKLPALLDLEKTALENRPELAAISAEIRQDETRTQLAEKSLKPDYMVSGGYMLMPEEARYRNTYMAELSITLPWLNRGRHEAEIAEASAMVAAKQAEYESRRAAVFAEIQESVVRARVAQRLATLYQDTLRPQAQAVLKAAVAAYQADRTDFLNLLDSQNTRLEVELAYVRAISEWETRLVELERAIGAPLPRSTSASLSISPEARGESAQSRLEVQ